MMYANRDTFPALGRHITIEYYDCSHEILMDRTALEDIFLDAAGKSGATVISSSFNDFTPQGVSGVVIIAESHFTVHTWPEHDYAAADIFTCGDTVDFNTAIAAIRTGLKAGRFEISSDRNRGVLDRLTPGAVVSNQTAPAGDAGGGRLTAVSWEKDFRDRQPWGLVSSVDIYGCDPDISGLSLKMDTFARELCDFLKMERTGECHIQTIEENGVQKGVTMTQMINASFVSAHFDRATHTAYIDICSSRFYEPRPAAEFALSFFRGAHYRLQVRYRQ